MVYTRTSLSKVQNCPYSRFPDTENCLLNLLLLASRIFPIRFPDNSKLQNFARSILLKPGNDSLWLLKAVFSPNTFRIRKTLYVATTGFWDSGFSLSICIRLMGLLFPRSKLAEICLRKCLQSYLQTSHPTPQK